MTSAWPEVALGAVVEEVSRGQVRTQACNFASAGRVPLVDQGVELIGGYTDDEAALAKVDLPVIVFGDHTRVLKWIDFPFGVGADGVRLLRARPGVDAKFLLHALRARPVAAAGYSRHFKYLKRITIPLPPIEEQRRISAILDQADELRAKRRTSLALLDSLTESIFLDMFGDPVANPRGWDCRAFVEVCPTRLGKMLDQKRQSGLHRRPYLRNANVRWFSFDLNDVAEMDFEGHDLDEFRLSAGDVLICEGGEPGRAAIWSGQTPEMYFQKALHRGRPDPTAVTGLFLVHLMWHLARRGGLVDHISSATISHLTGERLKAMKVPIPPLALQQQFGDQIEGVESTRASDHRSMCDLDSLFASLQQRAFAGEL